MIRLATALALVLTAGVALPSYAQTPLDTRPPHGANQKPQSSDQTRAPLPEKRTEPAVSVIAEDLPQLWSLEVLPDGGMLVTAKEGRMFIVGADGSVGTDIAGVPEVDAAGQGGLLDVALAPDFDTSQEIFVSFSEPRDGGNATSVARAKLVRDDKGARLEGLTVIFRQTPAFRGNNHFGSRLVFGPKGELFVTVGERSNAAVRVQAQDIASGLGKVFRIDRNGAALPDNPFVGTEGALPEIWSLGHRNMQSATLDGQGRLWTVEHGPRGGDELNRPEAGKNYGWPEVTYGIDYSGAPIGAGKTAEIGTEQPVYYWDPVIAPSGMAYYHGETFPHWQGTFLVGGLVTQAVVVLHMDNDRVVAEEHVPVGARVRDVKAAPDGSVLVVTETRGGSSRILRLTQPS
ncbi:PQQ-dependent sugar dehydrogenase [Kaistia sp. UC242_56]|uniref:PQQ-dependent sugar dehydrogenase n=1 Tax=Kaistia sp. UC242_56 TaxID=3374625 RepID=UPI0037A1E931